MKYLKSGLLGIIFCLLLGCTVSEEQATNLVATTYPASTVIQYEPEGTVGHYYICHHRIVIYVRTNRDIENAYIIKSNILNPDSVRCGE